MQYVVESNNVYLRYALLEMNTKILSEEITCIIDLESFNNLTELIDCVHRHYGRKKIIFIGGQGIYSNVLLRLISFKIDDPIDVIFKKINECPGVSYYEAIEELKIHKFLHIYSFHEKNIAYSLMLSRNIPEAIKRAGLKKKTFYQRMNKLTRKLNFKNSTYTHFFLKCEFSDIEIRNIINNTMRGHLRKSL